MRIIHPQAMLPTMNMNFLNGAYPPMTSSQTAFPWAQMMSTTGENSGLDLSPSKGGAMGNGGLSMFAPGAVKGQVYTCTEGSCGFTTRESREYLHHLRELHGDTSQIFYCEKCSYASNNLEQLGTHQWMSHPESDGIKTQTGSSQSPGQSAGDKSSTVELDTAHLRADERVERKTGGSDDGKVLKCDSCPYQTEELHRYKKHLRCHQTTADTKCKFCDFQTVYSWNLDRHVRCHNTPGRYTCLKCSFSQNTRQSMSFHLLHHHTPKRVHAETQTDVSLWSQEVPLSVQVDQEPYIWEIHAVRFNPEILSKPAQQSEDPQVHQPLKCIPVTENGESVTEMETESLSEKKYLSEQDAIETPSDERDMRDMEKDPDIQTRTCSICGYQGKWISEMIRHKRVHTNERPFRCKYCSRTSKWKADLIRHVAKVHNIRVVSKYSRSKTFDSDPTVMRALKEAHGFMDQEGVSDDSTTHSIQETDLSLTSIQPSSSVSERNMGMKSPGCPKEKESSSWESYLVSGPSEEGETIYWCKVCSYETRDLDLFRTHTDKHENKRPYQCSECGYRSNWSSDVYKHIRGKRCADGNATVIRHSPAAPTSKTKLSSECNFKCSLCSYSDSLEENVVAHLKTRHDLAPFGCKLCKFNSSDERTVEFHLQFQHGDTSGTGILSHIREPVKDFSKRKLPSFPSDSFFGGILKRCRLEKKGSGSGARAPDPCAANKNRFLPSFSAKTRIDDVSKSDVICVSSPRNHSESPELEGTPERKWVSCHVCPFKGAGEEDLVSHSSGHDKPTGVMAYKCVFCPWYEKQKGGVLEHMLLHTHTPFHYAAEVEMNLITPLSEEMIPLETDSDGRNDKEADRVLMADVSDVVSDFSAILSAAGEDLNLNEIRLGAMSMGGVSGDMGMGMDESGGGVGMADNEGSESEAEIENEEAYIHGGEDALDQGLDFVKHAPAEIQKVNVFVDGESKKMWKCRFCEHTSKRRANVRSHEKKHFKKNPVGLLRCPRCSYRGDKRSLNAHFRVHSGSSMPERYPCSKCPANFRSRLNLVKHMTFHGAHNTFKCPSCDYSVTEESHLADHRRVHSNCQDEKNESLIGGGDEGEGVEESGGGSPLPPPVPEAGDLRALLTAKQSKPKRYSCPAPTCQAKFSDTTQLKRHEQYHSDDRKYPHECTLCNYSVPYSINLIKHLRAHHDIPLMEVDGVSRGVEAPFKGTH